MVVAYLKGCEIVTLPIKACRFYPSTLVWWLLPFGITTQKNILREYVLNNQIQKIMNAVIVTGEYIDKQGQKKKSYLTIGKLFIYAGGGMSLKLDAFPANNQPITFYDMKAKSQQPQPNNNYGGNQQQQQQQPQPNNNYGGNQPQQQQQPQPNNNYGGNQQQQYNQYGR